MCTILSSTNLYGVPQQTQGLVSVKTRRQVEGGVEGRSGETDTQVGGGQRHDQRVCHDLHGVNTQELPSIAKRMQCVI